MTTSRSAFRKWLAGTTTLLVMVLGMALVAQDAEARRLGGGKSFGRQTMSREQSAPPARTPAQDAASKSTPAQTPATAPQSAGNRWMGPLTGIAAGLGIAALLSHFGLMGPFAEALGSMLVIALLVFGALFVWRMLRRPAQSATDRVPMRQAFDTPGASFRASSSAETNAYGAPVPGARQATKSPVAAAERTAIPADFDVEGFLRNAKVHFNRLQAAWDAKDLADIRKFTTPEVFAEIRMQRDEETGSGGRTEVDGLEASLLGIETESGEYVASVRFTGTIRENGGNPEPFEEVWNLVKPVDGRSGWLLGGIQQVH